MKLNQEEVRALFEKYDQDGGGTIDLAEFVEALLPARPSYGYMPARPHQGKF